MKRILPIIPWILAAMIFGPAADAAELSGPELGSPWESVERLPATGETAESPIMATPLAESSSVEMPPAEMPATDEMATPLLSAEPRRERSEQLEQVAQQADRQTRHGCELAGRGAHFAARSEFLAALKLVAEGLDAEQRTDAHGHAFQAALTAMSEAEDFLPNASRLDGTADLARTIAMHATPVLKDRVEPVAPMTALSSYLTFAQQQFAAAADHEVAGSMALHALGKLHCALARAKSGLVPGAETKAMVFYQAALLVYPNNFMAANDLGVLLAQNGNNDGARAMLERSIALRQQSTTWRNLAVVYRQLGQAPAAQQAERQAAMLEQAEIARRKQTLGTADTKVQWTDSQTFAKTSANTPTSPGAVAQPSEKLTAESSSQDGRQPSAARRTMWGSPVNQR